MVFRALNCGQSDCGKKIQTSKKKFYWTFMIDDTEHTLELISSFLSGKKKILLDSMEIYSEKKLLNINFEFRHTIEDHSFRITQDKLEFECYVDNESFQSLMHRGVFDENKKKKTSKIEQIKTEDPFADFADCFNKNGSNTSSDAFNDFGDFNMDYSKQQIKQQQPVNSFIKQPKPPVPQTVVGSQDVQTDFFGFAVKDAEPDNQFFTGQFSTNNNVVFGGSKPIASDNFFEDEFQKQQIQQQKQKQNNQKGFFGKVENAFKNLYNQIPTIGKGNSQDSNNNVELL